MLFFKTQEGIRVRTEVYEDLWHLEHLIRPGDIVVARTHRVFKSPGGDVERKPVTVKLLVEKVSFHPSTKSLRILGTIVDGYPEEYVPRGKHHSLEISLRDELLIIKDKWLKMDMELLKEAKESARKPKVGILVLDNEEASYFLLYPYGLEHVSDIHSGLSGKYKDTSSDKAKEKYFEELKSLVTNSPTDVIVVAGPGFIKEEFANYMKGSGKKLVVEACSCTGRAGAMELIRKGCLDKLLSEMRYATEIKLIEEFLKSLGKEPPMVAYGSDIKKAIEYGAVDKLLVSERLFVEKHQELEQLMDLVESLGGKVYVLSSEHAQQLNPFGGMVAILRFPIGD